MKAAASAPREWDDLVSKGFVEYIDVRESENVMIAMDIGEVEDRHTHAELHPSAISRKLCAFNLYRIPDRRSAWIHAMIF